MNDPITVKWIEDFLDTRNQLEYHGLGAEYMARFGGTWDGPLLELTERPKEVVVVSKRCNRGSSHHGLETNPMARTVTNPYIEDRYVEYDIDIDPVSFASRILAIREQIAKEWLLSDMDVITAANDQILDSYFKLAKEEREKKDRDREPPSLAFERTAAMFFANKISFEDKMSLLRRGNFDLLYNLCTQASCHRLLRDLREAGKDEALSFEWLRDFYLSRLADYFDGDQNYGRADDFLEELLRAPPSVITKEDGTAGLADPMALAERIIQKRNEIVQEWKAIMARVPQDHIDGIRRLIMNKQLEAWGSSPFSGTDESSQEGFE